MLRRKISLPLNLALAVVVFAAWAKMVFHIDENGVLSSSGLYSLKYFTVLSNLLQAIVSLAWAAYLGRALRGRAARPPRLLHGLRHAAVVSVALTFLTVVCFLGPVFGFRGMFSGANFWFHLVVPLASALDFCLLDREGPHALRETPLALIPMLLYGVGYVANLLINGVGQWPHSNDWYGFASGGPVWSAVVFLVIILGTAGIALLLRLPRRRS